MLNLDKNTKCSLKLEIFVIEYSLRFRPIYKNLEVSA